MIEEKFGLSKFISDTYIKEGDFFRRVNHAVILDNRITFEDIAVYIGILYYSSIKKNYYQLIESSQIKNVTKVLQPNQSRAIRKLVEFGYIKVKHFKDNKIKFCIVEPKKFFRMKREQFDSMKYSRKVWINIVIGLVLSNENNCIPSLEACRKKMGGILDGRKYQTIVEDYGKGEHIDTDNYLNLINK
jgi:hypothetical protein